MDSLSSDKETQMSSKNKCQYKSLFEEIGTEIKLKNLQQNVLF